VTGGEHAERFTHLRPLLFTIAYEILGSATESDDVLQDSYLRWAAVDLATVRDTKSYLAQLVTRQALNALRASARRREHYIGPWLPEPLLLDDHDGASDVVLAESVSMAMLVLLETLGPDERAVFVLREVFGFDYDEIAGAVGKSVSTVRQVAHRAREHVRARRKRFEPADPSRTARITERFMTAAATGDMEGLLAMLAPTTGCRRWRQGHGGPAPGGRRREGGRDGHGPVRDRAAAAARPASRRGHLQQHARDGRPQRREARRRPPHRDRRREDHELLRHPQSGQAGRPRGTAHDQ
jgi:RNA polymerase sigma-70 factor (ECF subfamily)